MGVLELAPARSPQMTNEVESGAQNPRKREDVRFFIGSLIVVLIFFLASLFLARVDQIEFASSFLMCACFGLYAVLESGKKEGIKAAAIGHIVYNRSPSHPCRLGSFALRVEVSRAVSSSDLGD